MSTGIDRQVLLRMKFHRPRVLVHLIDRPSLNERLDSGWDRPLILVAAPAGFGKSTLLSAWLEACACPHAWLSLDEHDNDLGVFLAYFLAAVCTIFPNALAATQALVSGISLPPLTVIARSLLHELDELERDFVLVLDDYHMISAQPVHDLLAALLLHPSHRNHLVIATRQDPPIPLRLLRARAQIAEIRGQDLRCSVPEIAQFMARTLGAPPTDEAVAVLAEKTGQTTSGQPLPEAPGQWPARGGRQRDPSRLAERLTSLSPTSPIRPFGAGIPRASAVSSCAPSVSAWLITKSHCGFKGNTSCR